MGWGILGDALDAVGSGFEFIGEKAVDGYNMGTKFIKDNADTIADVAGAVGDVGAFLAPAAAVIPGIGTVTAAGLAGLAAAGKGVEALAKGAKATTKAIDSGTAAIDALRRDDTGAAFSAIKDTVAAGKQVSAQASAAKKQIERKKTEKKK